jgi:hypothetical protein
LIWKSGSAMEDFSASERKALTAGDTVTHPMAFARGDGRYVGGVAYQIVRATPDQVLRAMTTPGELPDLLPSTREARLVSTGASDSSIELVSGTALVNARYTVRFRRVAKTQLKFWLDPSRPHGIRDVWGFVSARPIGPKRSLLAVGVALDVGSALVRLLFEDDIQETILTTPRQVRDVLEARARERAN